jgi:DNA-binding NarL/FixJ family response regulator
MRRQTLQRARVLLADGHPGICSIVAALLAAEFEIVGMVCSAQEMLAEEAHLHPDVVVLDISIPLLNGIAAASSLAAQNSTVKVVFLTVHDEAEFFRAGLAVGGSGYVLKRRLATDLIPAIHASLKGRSFVSPGVGS